MSTAFSLSQLGWRAFYSQQLTLEEFAAGWPARVMSVHRNATVVLGERGECSVTLAGGLSSETGTAVTVGDWVMIESSAPRISRVLERASLVARMAAGTLQRVQLIAANLDTLFIATSCNDDFNPSRLERYLALALDARVEPVIVLTKADLCADTETYVTAATRIAPMAGVVAVNALADATPRRLAPWLGNGQSVAFVGSSGVGKSTLVNTLTGSSDLATGAIREDDARGRHTTTSRQLIAMPGGAWLMDTPGMRELKLSAADAALHAVFTDVETLAADCRFRDCSHQGDEGCAVAAAAASGRIDPRRVKNYLKLQREAANAARTTHERHEQARRFGKMQKALLARQRKEREGK